MTAAVGRTRGSVAAGTVIGRPVHEVFQRLLDLENAQHFDPDVRSVQRTTSGPLGTGTTYVFVEPVPPFGRVGRTSATYTAVEPDRRIEMRVTVGPLTDTFALSFAPEGDDATRVGVTGELHPPGLARLLAPLLARQASRTWDRRLGYVKRWLEAATP